MDPELADEASSAHEPPPGNPPAPEPVNPDPVEPVANDPTRDLIYHMLNRMDQQQAARDPQAAVVAQPDFLQLVMMVKKMGRRPYLGGSDPFAADAWLHNLERNFAATRCPADYKT
ncbi:unnamed protein product [Arabis nemorensis]|uniref:Retrotransposon gag domain-containing protein n=1 Tax=Arabis nemorensis TaxID=586526 RepID=A0A565CRT6_9BRAS|nr:unnamed protein product [Arabis nemorensis]